MYTSGMKNDTMHIQVENNTKTEAKLMPYFHFYDGTIKTPSDITVAS